MKQRTTFFVPRGSKTDPANVEVTADALLFPGADQCALEKRFTFGLGNLGYESTLRNIHELHIRWSSPVSYETTSPNLSRLPPGLHVFYTPRDVAKNTDICPELIRLFPGTLSCLHGVNSFSRQEVTSERFASSSTYQFYSPLQDIQHFRLHVARYLCEKNPQCIQEAATLDGASTLDIDFDTISHAVTVTAYWTKEGVSKFPQSHKIVKKSRPQDTVEVGILQTENADEPEELKLGGILYVLGADEKPDTTLFSFPSRHHQLPGTQTARFSVELQSPTGLHPKLNIKLPRQQLQPPKDSCALHAYLTLPSSIFLDRYQFSDSLFLQSQNLVALRSLTGETDLEAPNWVVDQWGSAALFQLAHPLSSSATVGGTVDDEPWTITVPTHLRYLRGASDGPEPLASSSSQPPSSTQDHRNLSVPHPVLFWACEAEDGLKMSVNPFDRVNLGYDGLFGPKTMFYHIPPETRQGPLFETITVPTLDPNSAMVAKGWVTLGTAAAVLLGFGWVVGLLVTGVTGRKIPKTSETTPTSKKSL